jgi:hypothetical protein
MTKLTLNLNPYLTLNYWDESKNYELKRENTRLKEQIKLTLNLNPYLTLNYWDESKNYELKRENTRLKEQIV